MWSNPKRPSSQVVPAKRLIAFAMLKILDVQHSFASQDSYDSRTRIQSFHKKYSKLHITMEDSYYSIEKNLFWVSTKG